MFGFERSSRSFMFAGLSSGTIMISRFLTKTSGLPATRPSFTAVFISSWAAEAKTSAGAPCCIWASSSEEAPKLVLTVVPGFCCSKILPSSAKASVSEEAASMVSVPPCCLPPPPEPPLPPPELDPEPPHPIRTITSTSTTKAGDQTFRRSTEASPRRRLILSYPFLQFDSPNDLRHELFMLGDDRHKVSVQSAQICLGC